MKSKLLIGVAVAALISTIPAMTVSHAQQSVQMAQSTATDDKAATKEEKRLKRRAERRKKRQDERKKSKAGKKKDQQTGQSEQQSEPKPKKDKLAVEPPKPQQQNTDASQDDGRQEQSANENAAEAIVDENRSASQRERAKKREQLRRERKRKNRRNALGAFAAGAVVGAVVNELGGKVVEDQGDRIVVERNGRYLVRRDENDLFRQKGSKVFTKELPNRDSRTTAIKPNGVKVVSLRDARGTLVRRVRIEPNGKRYVLFDNRESEPFVVVDYRKKLGPIRLKIAADQYIVESRRADRRALRRALAAKPVEKVERSYSLNEVRSSARLREKTRRVDLDTITFATGEFALGRGQVDRMADVAGAINDIIKENPREIFLVEGHTDAVGGEVSNLTLSDRRAESAARILTEFYEVPAENLVVQGYGETNLKIATDGDERKNRRVTVRRITPLLKTAKK